MLICRFELTDTKHYKEFLFSVLAKECDQKSKDFQLYKITTCITENPLE